MRLRSIQTAIAVILNTIPACVSISFFRTSLVPSSYRGLTEGLSIAKLGVVTDLFRLRIPYPVFYPCPG